MPDFGERLCELMFDMPITALRLARDIDVDVTTVCRWKRNANGISLSNLLALADYFQCSLEFLAGRTETKLDYTPKPCPPFYDSFRAMLKKQGISRYRFTLTTPFKDNFFTKWKAGTEPYLHTLIALSDCLHCTLDCLVGRDI